MSKGNLYYGMHMYDGVCGYTNPKTKAKYRVYVNEATIRNMDPSFTGRPVFVEHVDEVNEDLSQLRAEADGWVVKSFYNDSDGKHWVQFLITSAEGEAAISAGFKLSNCYVPQAFGPSGTCNAVEYDKEMTEGVYHHLALVKDARYNESVVLTPEQFREYNESQVKDLQKYANHQDKEEETAMGAFEIFTRSKLKNSAEIADHVVVLPKSKREVSIAKLCNDADEAAMADPKKVSMDMLITVDGTEMTIQELLDKYTTLKSEVAMVSEEEDDEETIENADEEAKKKKEAEEAEANKKKNTEKTKNAADAAAGKRTTQPTAAQIAARKANEAIKNAADNGDDSESISVETSADKRERGRQRYGSLK